MSWVSGRLTHRGSEQWADSRLQSSFITIINLPQFIDRAELTPDYL